MDKKVKNILFKMDLDGRGIINYDGEAQIDVWNEYAGYKGSQKIVTKNAKLAKHNWYRDENGNLYPKVAISSTAVRRYIFKDDIEVNSPETAIDDDLLTSLIATPALIWRGYLCLTRQDPPIKRSSALNITDAEQTNNAVSYIQTFSNSGPKRLGGEKSDNSFYFKESIGAVTYSTVGNLDLMQLQFISADQVFDRIAINPDLFSLFSEKLKEKMPDFNSKLKNYQIINSVNRIPEYGMLFTKQDINFLVKYMLKKLLTTTKRGANAYVKSTSVKIKLVYDVFKDTMYNNDGWIELTEDVINSLEIDPEIYYMEDSSEKSIERKNEILKDFGKLQDENKEEMKKAKKVKKEKSGDSETTENNE